MTPQTTKLILWTGPKHAGKTTALADLVECARRDGFSVAGLLSLARYRDGNLLGFDLLDVTTQEKNPLARRVSHPAPGPTGFTFNRAALKQGYLILSDPHTTSADLIVIDEFGPLELDGHGWRHLIDTLLTDAPGHILIVVRDELLESVRQLYSHLPHTTIPALEPQAADTVLQLLKSHIANNA